MELAPYLFANSKNSFNDLLQLIINNNYEFFNLTNLKKIKDIHLFAKNISSGSSKNILLM